jgi:hypothetical protein
MAYAVANLIENGYLKKNKHSKGKDKGFCYTYVISEYGNLNPNKEKADENEILDSLNDEEAQLCDDSVPEEPNHQSVSPLVSEVKPEEDKQVMVQVKESEQFTPTNETSSTPIIVEQPKVFVSDPDFDKKVSTDLAAVLNSWQESDFVTKVAIYYMDKVYSGETTAENYNKEKMVSQVRKKIMERCKLVIEDATTKGTAFQRSVILKKAVAYCEGKINNGETLDEHILRGRMHGITAEATRPTYNSVDPRYLD